MSYILDALKRADAERGRGTVPGLHARQLPGSGNAAPANRSNRVWMLITTAMVITALAAGLWAWRMPTQQTSVAVAAPMTVTPPSTPAPVAVTPVPAPPAPLPLTAPPAVIATPPAPRPVTLPAPLTNAKIPAKPSAAAPVASHPPASQDPPVAPAPAPAPVPLLSELPDVLRRQIPALTITGTVYSDDPKQRLLLINNQVLPQGSVVAAEVSLEEIKPHSSVFNFRGTRFRVSH